MWFGIICLVSISGCAINTYNTVKSLDQLNQKSWEIDGRIFLQYKDDVVNAKFTWAQHREDFECIISGPFGLEKIVIKGDSFGATEIMSSDHATDIQTILGQEISILDLKYWLLGKVNPSSMSIIISQIDGYKEFRQNNWTVKINKYQNIDSYNLPKNIQARNTTSNLRIIIDKWRL